MEKRNYWGYRIDTSKIDFFWKELLDGRLRQGWGWLEGQDLRDFKVDEGAGRNRSMFNKVKKGDILLVPRLPEWDFVAVVIATEDWDKGYDFKIDPIMKDYGHIFPAKYIKKFVRHSEGAAGNIRATLGNIARFWNIGHCADNIEKILKNESGNLEENKNCESRLESSIENIFNDLFNRNDFSNKLYEKLTNQFSRDDWEYVLVHGLKKLFPHFNIERRGGKSESEHGTDILIKIPGIIPDFEYCIAIQVKDYEGLVAADVIAQINKADYWNSDSMKLIEKIVIVTKADKDDNLKLADNASGVKFIFASELKQLLSEIGQTFIGIRP